MVKRTNERARFEVLMEEMKGEFRVFGERLTMFEVNVERRFVESQQYMDRRFGIVEAAIMELSRGLLEARGDIRQLDDRMGRMEHRMESMDQRMGSMEQRMEVHEHAHQ